MWMSERMGEREGKDGRCDVIAPTPSRPFLCRSPTHLQALAVHKGKHLEGSDKEEPSIWKTRLLCAINKSMDFGTFESASPGYPHPCP